jgi:hypothetical protein
MANNNYRNTLIRIIDESKEEAKKIFITKYGHECEKALKMAIEQFYDDYTPKIYQRQGGLLDAYQINPDGSFDFKSSLISGDYSVGKDYIYTLAFEEGYHGGSKDGEGHPSPGTPLYKTPYPTYENWGRQAEQTTPIIEMVDGMISWFGFDAKYEEILLNLVYVKIITEFGGVL